MKHKICSSLLAIILVVCLCTLTTPIGASASHGHIDACYKGTKHSHTGSCSGITGYCSGSMTSYAGSSDYQVVCGTIGEYSYGTYTVSETPSGRGWCSNCGSYYDTASVSTWVHTYCSGCGALVHKYHYAASAPCCGERNESVYNQSYPHNHTYTKCSGCGCSGTAGSTHYKTQTVSYYSCNYGCSGTTSSYGSRCGAAQYGWVCGYSDRKWYLGGSEDSPICNNVVITMTFR